MSAPVLPPDFAWHQSSVATMLQCPERFRLRYVEQVEADHRAANYAAQLGTADHAGIEHILHRVQAGEETERQPLLDAVMAGFEEAVARATERGASFDPDDLDRALERLEGERLERLLLLAADPRLRAIDWRGIEWRFKFRERRGRLWQGTLDAWGVALEDVEDFGQLGRDPIVLRRGDGLLVDWKTGEPPAFGFVERTRNVQLGLYGMALAGRGAAHAERWRTFLGITQDLDRPKAPTDDHGKRIPKKLPKELNPAYVAAHGGDEAAARKSKRRPKDSSDDPIPKWLPERLNPAWEAACSRPRGPVFREARVDYRAVLDTVRAAIRQAELGIFPASGAATGQCGRCPYSTLCTASTNPNDQETP